MLSKWLVAASLAALLSVGICQTNGNPSSDDYTCSSSKPCKIGCCSNSGVCGMGPTFCGAGNCTSSCDAKSECDPGYGSQWASAEKCPLNVCCSKFGFCGTTPDFCGTSTVTKPSCNGGTSSAQRVMGYYEGWSTTRACEGLYPEDLPYSLYTHLNYAFALIDPDSFAVAPMSSGDPELMQRLTALKEINPGLEVWLSIGGWSMNDADQPTAGTFSQLAGSTSAQSAFFTSLIQILQNYGFDGVDIDWEYPVAPERSGNPEDFANYPTFLTNLKSALAASGHNYGLTITLPSSYWYLQNFDIVKIEAIVDWFNVMTYDLHGTWDSSDPYIGPYVYAHTNLTEIDQTMDLMWRNNISPSKVTMGLGFYGRSFTLSDPSCTAPGCGFSAGGDPGPCTASAGTLSFAEIQDVIANNNPTITLDPVAGVKIVTWNGNQWVSYDDEDTLKLKVDYANNLCLGGVMVWAGSLDDSNGDAAAALSSANGRSNLKLANQAAKSSTLTSCVWGNCIDPSDKTALQCPGGLSPSQRSDGGGGRGNTGIYTGCPSGQQRNFCCPNSDRPTCTWRGTASLCRDAACQSNEVQVASDRRGTGKKCDFNHKNLCCQKTISDLAFGLCEWVGSAPICNFFGGNRGQASCPSNLSPLTEDKDGAGGEQPCGAGDGYKTLCCPSPAPFNNCAWYNNSQTYDYWPRLDNHFSNMPVRGSCSGGCPNGQTPIAADSTACEKSTTAYFCCDDPDAGSNPAPSPGDDSNLCEIPPGVIDESGESEPEDPNDSLTEIELYEQEADCYVGGVPDSGDPSQPTYHDEFKRKLEDLSVRAEDGEDIEEEFMLLLADISHEHFNDLEKRGAARKSYVCKNKPGKNRNKVKQQLKSASYQNVKKLLASKKKVYYANKKACGSAALTSTNTLLTGYKWVAEHVWEQQGVKTFLQSMIDGVGPGGTSITAGTLSWTPFSSTSSAFYQTWASAGVSWTGAGTSPMDTFFSILGTLTDSDNLLILDSQTNGMKAIIWQGGKDLVAATTWKNANHLVRLGLLSKIKSACDYMNSADAQTAFQTVYTNTLTACTAFQSVLAKGGITYDVPGAFKQFTELQFAFMTQNVLNWAANLPSTTSFTAEIAYWGSAAAASTYTAKVAKQNQATLQDMFNTIGTWTVFKSPS